MVSLSDKIRKFLVNAGFEFAGDRASNLELLRYFEREYGFEMMRFMEEEWVQEQLHRECSQGFLNHVREHVDEDRWDDFDADVESITGRAA
jgi:hypothetical protein